MKIIKNVKEIFKFTNEKVKPDRLRQELVIQ